jgi:hypothetical protein
MPGEIRSGSGQIRPNFLGLVNACFVPAFGQAKHALIYLLSFKKPEPIAVRSHKLTLSLPEAYNTKDQIIVG